jgi:hypothetical protein
MKKIILVSIAALLQIVSVANSKLTINTPVNSTLKVVINGRKYYSNNNLIAIKNLQPGYHTLSIYYIKNRNDFNQFYNNGADNFWRKVVQRQVLIRENFVYDITVNRFGKPFFDQQEQNSTFWRSSRDGNEDDFSDSDIENWDANNGFEDDYNDVDFFRKHANNSIGLGFARTVMPANQFSNLKQTLKNQNFENSRLEMAKQIVNKNWFNTNQITDLLNLFDFETSKLNLAKLAYERVIDKQNYFTITNAFNMQSSKDELMKFIRK